MNIKINKPYGLNFGTDLEYVSTYVKGKKGKGVEDYRILVKRVDNGEEFFLMLENMPDFFGKNRYKVTYVDVYRRVSPTQVRNKVYSYYDVGYNPDTVEELFDAWKKSDPMVHMGNYTHSFISKIKNYSYSYQFNNKRY